MKVLEVIEKKVNNEELNEKEIYLIVSKYIKNKISDEEMTTFLKAVVENGMSEEETVALTKVMLESGEVLKFPKLNHLVTDKHSTGGIGDKTTLIVASIVAACNVPVAKMSGRALGFTGGTIDKLESIPGFRVNLNKKDFIKQIKKINVAITSQTDKIAVADKKIYALRDVTNTVSSIPLIASSIMSKKLATGADVIVLDVKVGNGALVKTLDEARELANLMIKIGKSFDRKIVALITNMDQPLGNKVGNALEIEEIMETLDMRKDSDLLEVSRQLAAWMIALSKDIIIDEAMAEVNDVLENRFALEKFKQLVKEQGGKLERLGRAEYKYDVNSSNSGYVSKIDARKIGEFVMSLGTKRESKDDKIDLEVGVSLLKKVGDRVEIGDKILEIYSNEELSEISGLDGFIKYQETESFAPEIVIEIIK